MSKKEIQHLYSIFPHLHRCTAKSESTQSYNCIAFAAGDHNRAWAPIDGYYWPEGVSKDVSLDACTEAFETLGYNICKDPDPEPGFEKIAIWTKDGNWQHVAKQGKDGKWLSKLGDNIDIEHELNGLNSTHYDGYGNIACYMKRSKNRLA